MWPGRDWFGRAALHSRRLHEPADWSEPVGSEAWVRHDNGLRDFVPGQCRDVLGPRNGSLLSPPILASHQA